MMRLILALALVALTPGLAYAHTGVGTTADFIHGFEHPLGGIDHILAMVAVGVFAFVLGGRALWLVPLSFVGMMLVGFLLGIAQVELPLVELGIAASSSVIGGAAALGRPMPTVVAMVLVGVFAVFHGVAHGTEMSAEAGAWSYAAGFAIATAALHAAGIAAAIVASRLIGRHARTAAQVAGGVFALGGIGVLAGWL
jgi:urease accessory protein